MTDEELRDELMTLLLAGHETTATSLAWAVERLLRHPDKLERLADEVRPATTSTSTPSSRRRCGCGPVLPIVSGRLTEPMEIGGHLLPAGAAVAPCIYLVHRRADVYPDPHAFRPERFLERPAGHLHLDPVRRRRAPLPGASFALFEMKVVLSAIVRRARLRPAEPQAERVVRRAITLTPSRGAEVVLERRSRRRPRPRRRWPPDAER